MSILNKGCTCGTCSEKTKQALREARDKWSKGEREIVLKSYHYRCNDGCCDEYGTKVYANGFDLNCDGEDTQFVIENLMEFLGIENVNVDYEEDDL